MCGLRSGICMLLVIPGGLGLLIGGLLFSLLGAVSHGWIAWWGAGCMAWCSCRVKG